MNKLLCAISLSALLPMSACTHKAFQPAPAPPASPCSYSAAVKPVILSRCALSGCHDGSAAYRNFHNDSIVKANADAGRIRQFVFDLKIMPPANATPLNDSEKQILKCWLDNGALQN